MSRWRARWIWWEAPDLDGAFARGEPPSRPPDGFGFLRTTVELRRPPARARCRVTADSRYLLWVNGTLVGRGPVRSQPWAWTFDEYDIAALLHDGANAVGALTRHYGGPTASFVPAQPVGALGFGSFLFEAEIDDELLVSDDAWRALPAPSRRQRQHEGPPPDEELDGRALPHGWLNPGYDDRAWPHALLVEPSGPGIRDPHPPTEPYPVLRPRPIPPLAERVVVLRGDGSLFDAGEMLHAHPILEIDANAGTTIELTAGEALDPSGSPVLDVRRWTMRYTTAGVPGETVEAFEPIGVRFLTVAADAPMRTIQVGARERLYPRPEGASFTSSDPALDLIWRAGLRTLDLCTTDAFIDCPGREQRAWLGDAYGHALVHLLVDPSAAMVRRMLRLHAGGQRPDGLLPMVAAGDFGLRATTIPDHSLLWVMALAHAWRWTGDDALAEELLPVAVRALSWFEQRRGGDGLLHDLPGWVFVDWAQLQRGATFAPVDGLYALALDDAAALCDALGDLSTAATLRARADHTRAAFEGYWDAARGIYVDTVGGTRVSQHTNALAILCGAAVRARWDRILAHVLSRARVRRTRTPADSDALDRRLRFQDEDPQGFDDAVDVVEAQPFFSHFVHQAVAAAGRFEQLLALIRRWMPLAEAGTFGEYWDNPPGRASLCHAWSAVPLYDLAVHVLGVRPDGSVEPNLAGLAGAAGTIATRHGWLRVEADERGHRAELLDRNTSETVR